MEARDDPIKHEHKLAMKRADEMGQQGTTWETLSVKGLKELTCSQSAVAKDWTGILVEDM